jgi:type IV pilus secretin PilQ/predicted competence protein
VTINRAMALLVPVILAGALARASGPAPGPGTSVAQLKAISARLNPQGTSLVIEATEPAAYVATRPDPLTVDVDFRNVSAEGVANRFAASAKSPILSVAIEAVESVGAPASRVRITLTQPVAHRVHSERNTIVVDFDKPSSVPYVMAPLSRRGPDAMAALDPIAIRIADPIAVLGLARPKSAEPLRGGGPAAAALILAPQIPQPPPPPQAPPTPQVQATPQALGAPRTARTFSGNPVSLDFQGADLRAVLRTFSEISGLNMVIDPSVQGTVDVALRDVPWDQALDIILRANKLGYLVDGTIVRIAPLNVLADEETQKRKLADEQALAGDLRVLTKKLSYAKAQDLVPLLTKSALSPRGNVVFDLRTNTLIISDLADRLQTSLDLITVLDRPQPQVEIEARIVQTNKTYARALGIQWGFTGQATPALGNTTNLAFPNSAVINGTAGTTQSSAPGGSGTPVGTTVNLPAAGATSAIGLALGSINGAFSLDAQLSALESSGKVRLLSTPRVSTQNNVEAQIVQGVQIPYQSGGGLIPVTTTFIPAALTLKVTPLITEAGTVMMQILIDNGSPGALSVAGIPSINTQSAKTTVMVNDMETTVIGGIYASTENSTTDRTPGLSQIPVLKWLFRRDSVNDTNTELIIFITPRIIKG